MGFAKIIFIVADIEDQDVDSVPDFVDQVLNMLVFKPKGYKTLLNDFIGRVK